MAVYVLVHGAWSGAHTFRKVRPLLRAQGHEVFTPSLTGLGERSHLASPQVTLTTHVQDVVNALAYEDLTDVVLLGYSYGGMVVTGTLRHVSERVKHLVYLDAFVPRDGQSLNDMAGRSDYREVTELGSEWLVQPMARQFEDSEEARWATARRTGHPVGCFTEKVRLERELEEYPFSRTYIKATGEPRPQGATAFWDAADRATGSSAWRYREIDTNHMIANNRPEELAKLLLELA